VHKADNLPPSCAVVTKSGNLNFLEHSGPVQACNGTAFFYYQRQNTFYVAVAKLYVKMSLVLLNKPKGNILEKRVSNLQ